MTTTSMMAVRPSSSNPIRSENSSTWIISCRGRTTSWSVQTADSAQRERMNDMPMAPTVDVECRHATPARTQRTDNQTVENGRRERRGDDQPDCCLRHSFKVGPLASMFHCLAVKIPLCLEHGSARPCAQSLQRRVHGARGMQTLNSANSSPHCSTRSGMMRVGRPSPS